MIGSVAVRQYSQGSGPIFMSNVRCNGGESSILQCAHRLMPPSYCSHYYDVGVICEGTTPHNNNVATIWPLAKCENGTIRLYSESGSYFRRYGCVQICRNNIWGTVCDHFWDDIDASVVCKTFGYSPYGKPFFISINNKCFLMQEQEH